MRRSSARRLIGGAVSAVCPPGFFCMDTGFLIFVLVAMLAAFVFVYTQKKENLKVIIEKVDVPSRVAETKTVVQPVVPAVTNYGSGGGYDPRNPPPPARVYDTPADLTGMAPPGVPAIPIQIPTHTSATISPSILRRKATGSPCFMHTH